LLDQPFGDQIFEEEEKKFFFPKDAEINVIIVTIIQKCFGVYAISQNNL
jgi:hypothetical protein